MSKPQDPQTIIDTLISCGKKLSDKNDELQVLAVEKAEAEKTYRVSLAKKMLELRADGMSVSLTNDLARGHEHVANLKLKRDIAEGIYEACRDRIRDLRSQIDVMRSVLTWLREEKGANIGP